MAGKHNELFLKRSPHYYPYTDVKSSVFIYLFVVIHHIGILNTMVFCFLKLISAGSCNSDKYLTDDNNELHENKGGSIYGNVCALLPLRKEYVVS
jgi:hypothetical protein